MDAIETPQSHAGEAAMPAATDAAPAPVIDHAPVRTEPPRVEAPQPRSHRRWIAAALAILLLPAIAYWRRAELLFLLSLAPPYASAIAFVLLGIIGAFYKDNYRHNVAKLSAVTIMVVAGVLMGVNTYNDRAARAQDKIERAKDKAENAKVTGDISKSVDIVSGELKDFKDKVNPDQIRGDMAGLKSTMDKALNPPRASMLFTFAPYADPVVSGGPIIPVRDISLPLQKDGSVRVRFTLINNTDVVAQNLQVVFEICISCKYAKEPEGFTRILGSRETERNHIYGDAPARGAVGELAADVIPPPKTPSFKIRARYRCNTCVVEANGTEGTIHILRN